MALATAESIARLGRIDPADIMQNFLNWYAKAEFTPYGAVFDCGMTTARAILNFGRGVPLDEWQRRFNANFAGGVGSSYRR